MKDISVLKGRLLLVVMAIEFFGCFLFQELNFVFAKYTSLLTFVLLVLLVVLEKYNQSREGIEKKSLISAFLSDKELLVVIAGCLVAMVNLIVVGSNKGAFLTAADVMLAFYVMRDMEISEKQSFLGFGLGAVLLIWWYPVVHWEYNFNMTGMIFIITALLSLLFLERLKGFESLNKEKHELFIFQLVLYAVATLMCLLYHARCAMIGMLLMGLILLIIPFVTRHRVFRAILIFLSTLFSIAFTGLYILLDETGVSITILYKNIISGRQKIWSELWGELSKKLITGIGSSYELKSHRIFEVHNGLFDILVVHGIVVFIIVLYFMIKRLWGITDRQSMTVEKRIALAGVFAILFSSFFENFFINSPYLLVLVLLVSLIKRDV